MINCRHCCNVHNTRNNNNNFSDLQKARLDLIGEIQAIYDYADNINSSDNTVAGDTWRDIIQEELVHVGQLLALIDYLAPSQKQFIEQGIKEFNDRLNNNQRIRD